MSLALFLGVLLAAMALGMPVAFALLLAAVALMAQLDFFDAQLVAQNMIAGADSFPLMAVPFFLLAGELMNAGGLARRIVALAVACVGHIRGGLGFVTIAAAVVLASLSGSALADTAMLAALLVPMMRTHGYPPAPAAGLVAAGGIIAPVIPPSMPLIILGVSTHLSISQLFLAGLAPGLLMGLALVLCWRWLARDLPVAPLPRTPSRQRLRMLADAAWALALPVIILGGLRGGVFTPTEAAVIAAVYALAVSLLVYRELNPAQLYGVFVRAAKTTALVMFLCAAAQVSSYMITLAELPQQLGDNLAPLLASPRLLMTAIVLLLLAVGMVMDLTPTILILAPVLLPLAQRAGIDPVYFGVMFVLVGSIGLITPPVGTVLNVAAGVARVSLSDTVRGVAPFLLAYGVVLALLVAFPQLITTPARWLH
ncbi:TRAP transporter large permease [Plasticicumulans acidivorans]|uniref:TRAP transporter large permease protein n=1 Tax=Plasticicumulans acidivorans TaxID=886464 RepID=A0A317MYJ5_9GAMM|nr:TRAP transporter large permease subunit [Plasticicumulans acidivorans]PWV64418.1 tripartite ATP-independent transporter DctM subunit [Plasticicumulans acidivorans]